MARNSGNARAAGMVWRKVSSAASSMVSAAGAVRKLAPSTLIRARLRSLRCGASTSATPNASGMGRVLYSGSG